jgi:hypothetical protein
MAEFLQLRGFEKLSWEDQLKIVNMPDNLIAMKGSFNASKGHGRGASGNKESNTMVWNMIAREARVEQLIIDKDSRKICQKWRGISCSGYGCAELPMHSRTLVSFLGMTSIKDR